MEKSTKSHIEQVEEWLEEHVQVFSEPSTVTLSDFSVDWEKFSGNFRVSFDTVALFKKLSFEVEASWKAKLHLYQCLLRL